MKPAMKQGSLRVDLSGTLLQCRASGGHATEVMLLQQRRSPVKSATAKESRGNARCEVAKMALLADGSVWSESQHASMSFPEMGRRMVVLDERQRRRVTGTEAGGGGPSTTVKLSRTKGAV